MHKYKTKLTISNKFCIIPIMHLKTSHLRKIMIDSGIEIKHIWLARQFYKLKDDVLSEIIETKNDYGYDIWPIFIECNAIPEQLVALHKEILADDSIPHNIKTFTADESRLIIKRKEDSQL